jgi:hypothetical protein
MTASEKLQMRMTTVEDPQVFGDLCATGLEPQVNGHMPQAC